LLLILPPPTRAPKPPHRPHMDCSDPRSDLREELADDDEDGLCDGSFALPRNVPAPFAALPYPPLRLEGHGPTASRTEVVANMITSLLGVGVLAVPHALSRAGLLSGLLALLLVAVCSRQALVLLLGVGNGIGGDRPYLDLARKAFGPQGFAAAVIGHLFFTGGLLTAYLMAVADLLGQAASGFAGAHNVMPRGLLTLLALSLCAPGTFVRELRYLGPLGTASVAGIVALLVLLVLSCSAELLPAWFPGAPADPEGFAADASLGFGGSLSGFFAAARTLTAHFAVHAGALEVFGAPLREGAEELQDVPGLGGGRDSGGGSGAGGHGKAMGNKSVRCSPELRAASHRAYLIAGPLVAAVGAVGYLRFGDRVKGNVLTSFDFDDYTSGFWDILFVFAQALYGAVLVVGFAFLMNACRNSALELFLVRRSGAAPSTRTLRKATAAILVVCAWLAWMSSDLEFVLNCMGAWAAGPIAFAFPALLTVELARQRDGRAMVHPQNVLPLMLLLFTALLLLSSFGSLAAFAFSAPAGHSGHRITTHSLLNITTNRLNLR